MPKTTILWGREPYDGQKAITYEFKTGAEVEAFKLGIAEMDGWLGYDDDVPEGYVHKEETT